jgi:hypothetical protein
MTGHLSTRIGAGSSNLMMTLSGAGSSRSSPEHLPVIEHARKHVFGEHRPADVVVGVETLASPAT